MTLGFEGGIQETAEGLPAPSAISRRRLLFGTAALAASGLLPAASEAAGNPFALNVSWADRWVRYRDPNSGSTIIGEANGIKIKTTKASQWLLSKAAVTVPAGKGIEVSFYATDLNGFAGTSLNEAMLLYSFMRGDGTAGHPADVSAWNAIGSTRMEYNCFGYRTTFAPRGTDKKNDNHVRVRRMVANGTYGGHLVNDIHNPAGEPFAFPVGVEFFLRMRIKGTTFTWTQRRVSNGATRTLTRTEPRFADYRTGHLGFRAQGGGLEFRLRDFKVVIV
jgi:hypothetical protein